MPKRYRVGGPIQNIGRLTRIRSPSRLRNAMVKTLKRRALKYWKREIEGSCANFTFLRAKRAKERVSTHLQRFITAIWWITGFFGSLKSPWTVTYVAKRHVTCCGLFLGYPVKEAIISANYQRFPDEGDISLYWWLCHGLGKDCAGFFFFFSDAVYNILSLRLWTWS